MARRALSTIQPNVEEPSREDRFIATLQAALEAELESVNKTDDEGHPLLDSKERNALYANCVRFLAVLTKFTGGEDDGSYWGGKD